MKKLMIAAAIVCAVAVAQAATFDWKGGSKVGLVDIASATFLGNGDYAAGTLGATKKNSALTYTLTLLSVTDGTVVGTASGDVAYTTTGNKFKVGGIDIPEAVAGATYDYTLAITGSQNDMRAKADKEVDGYKYSYGSSTISAEFSGKVTAATMGSATLDTGAPSTWTVAGISKTKVEDVPEPTSAMLLLLGVAGLALKRKQK